MVILNLKKIMFFVHKHAYVEHSNVWHEGLRYNSFVIQETAPLDKVYFDVFPSLPLHFRGMSGEKSAQPKPMAICT